jgi:recombinational DNA repair ATPase RecF
VIVSRVSLSWFRGSADSAELSTAERSVVVFGENGAGKSCFVDAVEYTLRGGRITHLAHEYSGRNQEKAVLNTHRPSDSQAWIEIELSDRTEIRVDISEAGVATVHRQGECPFNELDCARTVLPAGRGFGVHPLDQG